MSEYNELVWLICDELWTENCGRCDGGECYYQANNIAEIVLEWARNYPDVALRDPGRLLPHHGSGP